MAFLGVGLSLNSLVGMALQQWGSDRSWEAIAALQSRGSPEGLACARRLAGSRNIRKRALGLYMASQLRQSRPDAPCGSIEYALDETQALLLAGLNETHPDVLCAAISGLGHRPHPGALPSLIALAGHACAAVRMQAAFALGRYADGDAVDALLRLAKDRSDEIRNWATFGIGTLLDADSPQIRAQLWANLRDSNPEVRGEALVGLALRKDERIIPELQAMLDVNCRVYELEAAQHMANADLLPQLTAIRDATSSGTDRGEPSNWHAALKDAIEACAADPRPATS